MKLSKLLGTDKYYCLQCREYHNNNNKKHKIHKFIPTIRKLVKKGIKK